MSAQQPLSGRRWPSLLLGVISLLSLASCNEWRETYEPYEDIPYGLDLLPEVLDARFGADKVSELNRSAVRKGKLRDAEPGSLYLAVSPGLTYTRPEVDELLAFADAGGHILLAAKSFRNTILDTFDVDDCILGQYFAQGQGFVERPLVEFAGGDTMRLPAIASTVGEALYIPYLRRDLACLPEARDLILARGMDTIISNNGVPYPWMVRFPFGSGTLDMLSTPVALSNVYLTRASGQAYVDKLFGFYPGSVPAVLYDRERYAAEAWVDKLNRDDVPSINGGGSQADESLLDYVLSRPALATAWYALLFGFIVFLLLGARRKQRVVPLVQPRRNTTYDHLRNISRLYLANPDNLLMTRKQLGLFEAYCTRKFGLAPLRNNEDRARLQRMQGVDKSDIDTLVRYHNTVQRGEQVTDGGLVRLVRILQAVYRDLGRKLA